MRTIRNLSPQDDTYLARRLDGLAVALFATAINEGRAGEVLAHLFDGGAVTYDVAADEILLFDLPPSPDEETPT